MGRRPKRDPNAVDVDGLLIVDKPSGMTSHDVVEKVKRRFNIAKIGHGGTLDPQATGLLVLLLGAGTKSSDAVMKGDKTYEGTIRLGVVTDSQDAEGATLEEHDPSGISRDELDREVLKWDGDLEQIPPMVSAIKKDGVALYKLAREGKSVEREPRQIRLYDFEISRFENPDFDFSVSCTKGTYIRTLAHDIGQNLGCGAHLAALRRTRSGDFNVADGLTLDDIIALELDALKARVLPPI